MEHEIERTFTLANGKDMLQYLQVAKLGEQVELINNINEKINLKFYAFLSGCKDLCSYAVFSNDVKPIIMRFNFKFRYLKLIDDEIICANIMRQMDEIMLRKRVIAERAKIRFDRERFFASFYATDEGRNFGKKILYTRIDKILIGLGLLFGVLAIIMLAVAGITPKAEFKEFFDIESYSMAKITFGYSETFLGEKVAIFKFSFPNLLTYIFIIVGMICAILAFLGKGGKKMPYFSAGLFLVGGILYFCASKMIKWDDASDAEGFTLGVGAILGGIFSVLASVAMIAPVFIKKYKMQS